MINCVSKTFKSLKLKLELDEAKVEVDEAKAQVEEIQTKQEEASKKGFFGRLFGK